MAQHDENESLIDKVKRAFGMGGDEEDREDTAPRESLHDPTARPDAAPTEREDEPDRPGPAT